MVAEQLPFAAAKSDGGVVLDVEEVGAAQMCVAIRLPRPEATGIDVDLDGRVLRSCGIEVEPAMDVFEVPADVSDHHVAYAEFGGRVSRFEEPSRQGNPLSFRFK